MIVKLERCKPCPGTIRNDERLCSRLMNKFGKCPFAHYGLIDLSREDDCNHVIVDMIFDSENPPKETMRVIRD